MGQRGTIMLLRMAAARVPAVPLLTITLVLLFLVQQAAGRCRAPPTISELVVGNIFGPKELVVRATLLAGVTKNSSCPVMVYKDGSYVDTTEGFGVLQVEEVFVDTTGRGTAPGAMVGFVYTTDTGLRLELPPSVAEAAAMSPEGILVFLTPFADCPDDGSKNATNTTVADEHSIYSISECDFGNGLPFDGSWANVSSEDQTLLQSFMNASTPAAPAAPAAQPTVSTLAPTTLPVSSAMQPYNNVLIATLLSAAIALFMGFCRGAE
jgi:hypothetical protein